MAHSGLSDAQRQVGSNMVTASLSLQAALFAAFGVLSALFHRRASKAGVLKQDLRVVLYVLYVSAIIVTIRCIFRLVEYVQGWESSLYQNEVYFYIFDASIMFLNTALLNLYHPGKRLPKSNNVFLVRDGVTERQGLGWKDERPWLVTVVDPFDVWGLLTGRDKETQFWDLTDEELERARLEKKRNKRGVLMGVVDPLRLWGEKGYIGRYFVKKKEGRVQEVVEVGDLKSEGRTRVDAV
jgi:hypothetical protein